MKIAQRKLFVGAVCIVVVQSPAEEKRIRAKLLFEVRDNWNRSALSHEHRRLAETLLDRLLSCRYIGTVQRHDDARRPMTHTHSQLDAGRTMCEQEFPNRRCDSIGILFWHQAKADVRARAGLNGR